MYVWYLWDNLYNYNANLINITLKRGNAMIETMWECKRTSNIKSTTVELPNSYCPKHEQNSSYLVRRLVILKKNEHGRGLFWER